MQLKSSRGVQQEDVWGAADALIAEGLRPTIERVRLKIGRGSPNTVSPLLETWFATLGTRLNLGSAAEGARDLPPPVRQAFMTFWESALSMAREEAASSLAEAQQAVASRHAALAAREMILTRQEQALAERQAAVDDALQVARHQISDLTTRLGEAQAVAKRQGGEIEAVQSKLAAVTMQRDADRLRNDENARQHAEERHRLEARATANERRLMEDVDRERQEAKRLRLALKETEREAEAAHKSSEQSIRSMAEKLQEVELTLKSERQLLASTSQRASELRSLLEEQQTAYAIVREQLSLTLATQASKPPVPSVLRRRRRT